MTVLQTTTRRRIWRKQVGQPEAGGRNGLLTRESPPGTPLAARIRRFEPVPIGELQGPRPSAAALFVYGSGALLGCTLARVPRDKRRHARLCRHRPTLSSSRQAPSVLRESTRTAGVFATDSRSESRVRPSGLQRGCGNGLPVPRFATACSLGRIPVPYRNSSLRPSPGPRSAIRESVGNRRTRWSLPRRYPRHQPPPGRECRGFARRGSAMSRTQQHSPPPEPAGDP